MDYTLTLSALEALVVKVDDNVHPCQLKTFIPGAPSVGVLQEPVRPEQILCQPIADKHETSTSFNSTKEERKENNKEENKMAYLSFLRQQDQRPNYAEQTKKFLQIRFSCQSDTPRCSQDTSFFIKIFHNKKNCKFSASMTRVLQFYISCPSILSILILSASHHKQNNLFKIIFNIQIKNISVKNMN